MASELEALVQRLEEVEKQIAHLAALMVEQSDTHQTVVAKQFVVKDAQGVRRAELGIPEGDPPLGPWLGLFDANEKVRACIGLGVEGADGPVGGPWVELHNEKDQPVVEIRADETDTAILLRDPNGKVRMALGVDSGDPHVTLFGENGKPCVNISADANGPTIRLFDEAGKPNLVLSGDAPMVNLCDANNKASLYMGFLGSGRPLLLMDDVNGEHRLKLGLETDGPRLVMSDKDGNVNANLLVQQGTPCLVFGKDGKVIWSAPPVREE
jgi:hypothetical protein